jgi:gamma-glutamylcyclotransferase (GGCT)/AIG2-like uncharacterized protein YtfP
MSLPGRRGLALILPLILLVGALYLWLEVLRPIGYPPPPEWATLEPGRTHHVFVYGTLRYPLVRWLVYGRTGEPVPARLPGYRKQGLDIKADPSATVEGLRLTVSNAELRALDRYERLGIRYRRLRVTLDDGGTAWVYQRIEPDTATLPAPVHTTLISGNGRFSAIR